MAKFPGLAMNLRVCLALTLAGAGRHARHDEDIFSSCSK